MQNRFLALAALSLAVLLPVQAQEQDLNSAAERTAACLSIEDAAERLACFEAAARSLTDALDGEAAMAGSSASSDASGPAANVAAAAPGANATREAANSGDGQNTASVPDWAAAPPAPEPEVPAEPEAEDDSTPIWARVFPRGDKSKQANEISVSVTRILRNNAGRHYFITADGQEWEQTMVTNVRPPKSLPAQATIESALVGSPRLTFDDGPSGAYKVRRTK
ncbi:hypothetical protein [Henriciella mobilis]|uniref:hypothetical protein n=1 Tax=Henriciella mobilis TaxID=2305467 RepID=UPI0011C42995|nr:hypothetical protein [Henriciella mobilis]